MLAPRAALPSKFGFEEAWGFGNNKGDLSKMQRGRSLRRFPKYGNPICAGGAHAALGCLCSPLAALVALKSELRGATRRYRHTGVRLDFLRLGLPLTVLYLILAIVLLPVLY